MRMRIRIKRQIAVLLAGVMLLGTSTGVYAEPLEECDLQEKFVTGVMHADPIELDLSRFDGNCIDAGEAAEASKEDVPVVAELRASAVYTSDWDQYSSNFYYNQMNAKKKEFWDALDEMCMKYLTKKTDLTTYDRYYLTDYVYSSELTMEEVIDVAQIFRYSNPQYYFLEPLMFYAKAGNNAGISIVVYNAFGKGKDRDAATKNFKAKIDSWISCVNGYSTDFEKVKAIHDLICANTTYNYDVLTERGTVDSISEQNTMTQSAYSTFCMGSTVCAGYAQAFEILCNGVGVDAIVVTSSDHEWNKVRMEDSWYNVDCTWDDQPIVCYEFFAKSDYAYDNLLSNASSHAEESKWNKYIPTCSLDSGSLGTTVGTLPVITETTAPVTITVECTYKHDKLADEDYVSGYEVTMSTETPGATIYYTTDGTTPSEASGRAFKYYKPFKLDYAEPLSAIAVCDQKYDSAVVTNEKCNAPSYKINYVLNGGKNSPENPKKYKETDETIKLKNPTKKGYTFAGWYRAKEFNTSKIKQIKSGSSGVIYLYAKWTPIKYKIKFDGNGATSGSMSTKQCKYGTSYKLTANKYKKEGYTFVGWSTKKNGKGETYTDKEKIKNLTSEKDKTITLYAQWKKN